MNRTQNRFGFYTYQYSNRNENYVVQKGDSLYSIAKKYGITVDSLINANDLTSNLIYPNQIIVIPKRNASGNVYFEEYVVLDNDTIEKIANYFNIDPSNITKYNDITKLILAPNQVIKVPFEYELYRITDEDTLESILEQTNMTLEELLMANYSNWLTSGKTILVKNK